MNDNIKMSTEVIHKEIDLIQSCISRMASNSFFLKGWLVSLIAILLTLLPNTGNRLLLLAILITVILSFWYLDAFFLTTEKKYRKMYKWVLEERQKGNYEKLYDLNPNRFSKDVGRIAKVMISQTLICFYGIPMLLVIVVIIYKLIQLIKQ